MLDQPLRDWRAMRRVALGFSVPGQSVPPGADGCAAVIPAARALRAVLPGSALLLLWPHGFPVPRELARLVRERIAYPVPDASPASMTEAVTALGAARCEGLVVLAAEGASPYLPAYLAYLAGVARRAAMTAEFGGGVLTDVVPPPRGSLTDAARHAALLRALGLVAAPPASSSADRRYAAAGAQ